MQSFGDLFASNKLLALGLLLAALAVILAVGIGLFRLTFGRRLHMSGGRTRQPRLGVVDAFDLDRQRQLVIIRRDNVEHLLMIGGPNDVLIEPAIVRAAAAAGVRDKENGTTPSVGIPAPTVSSNVAMPPAAAPATGNSNGETPFPPAALPSPVSLPEPQVAPIAAERDRSAALAEPPPVPQPSAQTEPRLPAVATLPAGARPMPPRTTPTVMPPRPPVAPAPRPSVAAPPRPNFPRANPVAPAPTPSTAPPPQRVEPVLGRPGPTAPSPDLNREDGPKAAPAPSVDIRGEERNGPGATALPPTATPSTPAPAAPSTLPPRQVLPTRPAPATIPQRQPVARPPTTSSPAPRAAVPSLGSLEEEMAKLLGRPMPPDPSNGK